MTHSEFIKKLTFSITIDDAQRIHQDTQPVYMEKLNHYITEERMS